MNNRNHRFNKRNFLLFTFVLFSLVTGYFLGSHNFNKSLNQQLTLTAISAPSPNSVNLKVTSSPNIIGVPAKTQNQIITEEQAKENEKDSLYLMKEYNQSLLNTILLSLLGTVVTITLAFFGFQAFSDLLSRPQEREAIKIWLKQELDKEINNINQILEARTEQKLKNLDFMLKWMEYQIAVLSAEQLEMQNQPSLDFILQERLRAIRILQNIESNHKATTIRDTLEEELDAVNNIISTLNENEIIHNKILSKQIEKTKIINNELKDKYKCKTIDEIQQNLAKITEP